MDTAVVQAMGDAHKRIEKRKRVFATLSLDNAGQKRVMDGLRRVIFTRGGPNGSPFCPLDDYELSILENCVGGYVKEGRLIVCGNESVDEAYGVLRHNLLTGTNDVAPEQFREASNVITQHIFASVPEHFYGVMGSMPVMLLMWRAGLAFGEAALKKHCEQFFHLGVRRNEHTLETEPYYEDRPYIFRMGAWGAGRVAFAADPMLASGNTAMFAIQRLKEYGVREDDIVVLTVISAPEGVDHVLSTFPGVHIVTGSHDECLDERGYIVPGLGDYGDKYFEGLGRHHTALWWEQGILSDDARTALETRMEAIAGMQGA